MKRTLAFALVLPAIALPRAAEAFIYLRGGAYQKGERPVADAPVWTGRVLRFHVNTDISALGGSSATSVTGAELLQAAQEAAAAWSAACRADLRVEVAGTTSSTYSSSDGANVIVWDRRTAGEGNYYNPNSATILAAATTVIGGSEFQDCDIVVNGAATSVLAFNPAAGQVDLRSVLAHEIGHCLGLDHPIEPPDYDSANSFLTEATMVQTNALPSGQNEDTTRRDIAQDDRDGVECLYERGRPFRAGARCGSYHGTNGQGTIVGQTAITGGPSANDTVCGSDAQGRNARPSEETGDGCIGSAIASSGNGPKGPRGFSFFSFLGSSWGLLAAFAAFFLVRRRFRRSLRIPRAELPAWLGVSAGALAASTANPSDARAWELELSFSGRRADPTQWKTFSAMDPTVSNWDRAPTPVEFSSQNDFSVTAFRSFSDWGKWGWFFSLALPKSVTTNAKAASAAEQTKETSIWGFRVGPVLRWYPLSGAKDSIRWYVGGRFGLGILSGTQTFSSTTHGSVSYRAYASEFAASTGAEVPVGPAKIVVEGGYARLNSSYFTSSGNEGAAYSDFPAGTRLAVSTGAGSEDLRFKASGLFAAIGVQIPFGTAKATTSDDRTFDDYETSPSQEREVEETAPAAPATEETARDEAPKPEAKPAADAAPAPTEIPVPAATPIADPLEAERAFEEQHRRKPAPTPSPTVTTTPRPTATPAPSPKTAPAPAPSIAPKPPLPSAPTVEPPFVPRKRESWEIDAPPETELPTLERARPMPPIVSPPRPPYEPDPVP